MTDILTAPTAPLPTINANAKQSFNLSDLAEKLNDLRAVPSLDDLNRWLAQVDLTEECLRGYRSFKPSTYARNSVMKSDYAEMLVLCWKPGQRTVIHDHNGSFGVVRVCEGVLWETMFDKDEEGKLRYSSSSEWRAGRVTGARVPDIHQLGNPDVSGQDLITIHIYAPPLGTLNTYKVGSTETGTTSFEYYMNGAGI